MFVRFVSASVCGDGSLNDRSGTPLSGMFQGSVVAGSNAAGRNQLKSVAGSGGGGTGDDAAVGGTAAIGVGVGVGVGVGAWIGDSLENAASSRSK